MNKKTRKLFTWCLVVALVVTQMLFANVAFAATSYAGADRYQTALKVVQAGWTKNDSAVIARGDDLADALAAAPLAYAKGKAPILLTETAALPAGVMEELTALGVKNVYIVGGTGAVSQAVETALAAKFTVKRLSGADRAATALAVANEAFPTAPTKAVMVNGYAVADALSISAIAAYNGMPILLVDKDTKAADVATYLTGKTVYAVGGEGVISAANLGTATRLSGADRYATNVAVLGAFTLDYSKVFVAVGEDANAVDALGGAAFAALGNNPIVLVNGALTPAVSDLLKSKMTTESKVFTLGGVVPASVATAIEGLVAAPAALKVESVSAINAVQVVVKFTQPVDKTSATDVNNYTLDAVKPTKVVLSSDAKSVTLTFADATKVEVTDKIFIVEKIQSVGDPLVTTPRFTQVFTFEDTVKPTVTAVESETSGTTADTVTVTASEPINSSVAKVDGVSQSISWTGDTGVITGLALDATKTHTLEILALTDMTSNITAYTTKTFSVTVDKVAPTATLSASSDKIILVTFSKPMNDTTVTTALAKDTGVKNESLDNVNHGAAVAVAGTNYTQYSIAITDTLYSTTKTTAALTVVLPKTMTDSLGNAFVATTKSITLSKDTVKPAVTGYKVIKDAAGKVTDLQISFSEGLKAAGAGTVTAPTVIDSNGVLVTSTLLGGLTSDEVKAGDKVVTFSATTEAKVYGKYTFTFAKSIVSDQAETANKNDAFVYTVDFGTQTVDGTFDLKTAAATSATSNIIEVDFGTAVVGGNVANSATDLANYTLSGKALPVGTTITLEGTKNVATIKLPAASIAVDDAVCVFTVGNVKSTDGKLINAYVGTVKVADNIAPVLKTAQVIGDSILLTYDTAVDATAIAADATTDYAITVGDDDLNLGVNVGTSAPGKITAAAVAGNAKQILLTIAPEAGNNWDNTETITVTTLATAKVVDKGALKNVQAADVEVVATK